MHKCHNSSTPFRSDTGGALLPTPQGSDTGRAVSIDCSTRASKPDANKSSTTDRECFPECNLKTPGTALGHSDGFKGSNFSEESTPASCHNRNIFSEVAASSGDTPGSTSHSNANITNSCNFVHTINHKL